jgi:hypothetical protein
MRTNIVESLTASVRKLCARVQHLHDGQMAMRWAFCTAMDAEKCYHRVNGHRWIPILLRVLRVQDPHLGLVPTSQAA